jgi:hypothetical protein
VGGREDGRLRLCEEEEEEQDGTLPQVLLHLRDVRGSFSSSLADAARLCIRGLHTAIGASSSS